MKGPIKTSKSHKLLLPKGKGKILGSGAAGKAGKDLKARRSRVDEAIERAVGSSK